MTFAQLPFAEWQHEPGTLIRDYLDLPSWEEKKSDFSPDLINKGNQ